MKRTGLILTAVAAIALGSACSEPDGGGVTPFEPAFDGTATSPRIYVLNTQLRGIINPEILESSAWGHVQIKLTDNGDGTFAVDWKGRIYNPDGDTFNGAFIIKPDINPGPIPGDGPPIGSSGLVFTFFRGGSLSCGIIDFDSQGVTDEENLPVDAAMDMIINPEIHEVVLLSDGGLLAGNLGLVDPTTLLGFNPQPDPPGRVRCAV